MEIKNLTAKIKCDLSGCKNVANYSVVTSDNSKHNLNICNSCLQELHNVISKQITPKSIKNIYQKGETNGKSKK